MRSFFQYNLKNANPLHTEKTVPILSIINLAGQRVSAFFQYNLKKRLRILKNAPGLGSN